MCPFYKTNDFQESAISVGIHASMYRWTNFESNIEKKDKRKSLLEYIIDLTCGVDFNVFINIGHYSFQINNA